MDRPDVLYPHFHEPCARSMDLPHERMAYSTRRDGHSCDVPRGLSVPPSSATDPIKLPRALSAQN